jgi:2-polyprenyl-3-methyl-5-hydroxy-6-metoxy-1,4-benzoquinol methylase
MSGQEKTTSWRFHWRRRPAPASPAPCASPLDGSLSDDLPVTSESVIWAMRLMIGREPASETELELHRRHASLGQLRQALAESPEFQMYAATARAARARFVAPDFLSLPPEDSTIPWRHGPPTLAEPVSQLCTAAQFDEPAFKALVTAFRAAPGHHRKLWEHVYIMLVLASQGMIGPGRKALGFGCGRERIPSLLASMGTEVLATDAPEQETFNQGWATTNQHANRVTDLLYKGLVRPAEFEKLVTFRAVDMNAIPSDLDGQFDCCWSSCSLEHLGSLQHGLDFIENSLRALRPGGIAVHTTEFNLTSNVETIETPGLSIYRRHDIEALASRLTMQGHEVLPLNFNPGDTPVDEVVDVPPYSKPHLKLAVGSLTLTWIGIAVRRCR